MIPLLTVHVTHNTEKTFSMFSRDPSRSLTLSQHVPDAHSEPQTCQCGHVSPNHSPYIDMLRSLPWKKLAWAFVSNGRAVCSISTKQAFYSLKPPGKSYVPQVGVRLVRMAYFRFIISQKSCLCSPFRHTSRDNIAHVQSQRT